AVPFREIALDPSANEPPVRVYDPSGLYTQDDIAIDLSQGLPPIRAPWLVARQGLETYQGRAVRSEDNGGATPGRLVPPCPANRLPRRGVGDNSVTQYEFARAGII